jgi:hypothetical protein
MQIPVMNGIRICDPAIRQGTVNAKFCTGTVLVSTMVIGTGKMLSNVSDAEHSLRNRAWNLVN